MLTQSILITGCNKGIGLELICQLAQHPERPQYIFATCRNPDEATDLREIATSHEDVYVLQLDVTDHNSFARIRDDVSKVVGSAGLNVLFNNAGAFVSNSSVETLDPKQMMHAYNVNAIAPAMLTKALLPLLRQASARQSSGSKMSLSRAAVLNMSSLTGSFADNRSGGMYPSRMARAATNMLTKNLSIELKKDCILAVALNPGWVKTDQGGSNAPWTADYSVGKFLEFLPLLNEEHSGNLYWCDGRLVPW